MAKFCITYRISGTMTEIIEAADLKAAERIADSNCEDEGFGTELDEADDIDFDVQQMYHVEKDGKRSWTTWVAAGETLVADEVAQ